MRNQINEQEKKHQGMFDTITKKLSDESFIASAVELTTETRQNDVTGWKSWPNSFISGWNNKEIKGISEEECKQRCGDETSFKCLSIDYGIVNKRCQISSKKIG